MRKRYRVLILAALAAALIVPFGFALELPSPAASVVATSAVLPIVPDTLKLFAVGTLLIGVAAFVRKAI